MQNILEFKDFLAIPRKVLVITHFKPDADALGSSLGLAGFLKKLNHNTTVITPSDYPEFLSWMPGNSEVQVFTKDKAGEFEKLIDASDLIFCLDFSSLKRITYGGSPIPEEALTRNGYGGMVPAW